MQPGNKASPSRRTNLITTCFKRDTTSYRHFPTGRDSAQWGERRTNPARNYVVRRTNNPPASPSQGRRRLFIRPFRRGACPGLQPGRNSVAPLASGDRRSTNFVIQNRVDPLEVLVTPLACVCRPVLKPVLNVASNSQL